ncbi:MAG: hypothetical protein RL272_1232 [Candidatus Parcubacteria bacterium]
MSPAAVLMASRLAIVRTALRRSGWAQRAVAACFFILAAAIIAGTYTFFLRSFRFVLMDDVGGPLILRYVLETAFAFVFFLGVSSFVVSSDSLIFRADGLALLVPMPVDAGTLYSYRFAAATALSSWPVLLIAVPALAALGSAFGASWWFSAFGAALALLFVLAIAIAGGLLSFLFAWILRPVPVAPRKFIEIAVFFMLGAALVRHVVPRAVFSMFDVYTSAQAISVGERLRAMFIMLPSHPFAAAAASIVPFGADGSAASSILSAAFATAAGAAALALIASAAYVPLWQRYRESGFIAGPSDRPRRSGVPRHPFPVVFRFGHSFLFEKDFLSFSRDGEAISRAGFLLLLLFFYLFTVRAVASAEAFQRADLHATAIAFTFGAIGYFALTLALRFVFPSLSLEGKGAWLVWSSPIHVHEIFSWKFFFWAASLAGAMGTAAVFVVMLFGFPWPLASTFIAAVLMSSVTLVALMLAVGSAAPDFRAKDPDLVTTSPAGLLATALGAAYLWIMIRYVHRAAASFLSGHAVDPLVLIGMSVVSLAVVSASWAVAMRFMDRMEIA